MTNPCGLNFITMFEPSSTTQRLSSLSNRMAWANEKPYAVLAPFLDVLAGEIELEELRRLAAARRTVVAAARVDEQMLLGVDGDAFGFANRVAVGHERQRDGVVGNLRRVLFELRLRRGGGLLLGTRSASAAAPGRAACPGSPAGA